MPQPTYHPALLALLGTTMLFACSDDGVASLLKASDSCASGLSWSNGNEGSELMHPGGDCIKCHGQSGEGPTYEIAGTVYESLTEEDDCGGLEGATIELTDINNNVFTMTSNAAGNFFMTPEQTEGIEYPATVKAIYDGRESVMIGYVPYGNCSDCHTRNGNWTAAGGRVYVPPAP